MNPTIILIMIKLFLLWLYIVSLAFSIPIFNIVNPIAKIYAVWLVVFRHYPRENLYNSSGAIYTDYLSFNFSYIIDYPGQENTFAIFTFP